MTALLAAQLRRRTNRRWGKIIRFYTSCIEFCPSSPTSCSHFLFPLLIFQIRTFELSFFFILKTFYLFNVKMYNRIRIFCVQIRKYCVRIRQFCVQWIRIFCARIRILCVRIRILVFGSGNFCVRMLGSRILSPRNDNLSRIRKSKSCLSNCWSSHLDDAQGPATRQPPAFPASAPSSPILHHNKGWINGLLCCRNPCHWSAGVWATCSGRGAGASACRGRSAASRAATGENRVEALSQRKRIRQKRWQR